MAEVKEFLKQNAFGILVNQTPGRPCATHIPLELDVDTDGQDSKKMAARTKYKI